MISCCFSADKPSHSLVQQLPPSQSPGCYAGSATQTGIAFAVGFVPYLFLSLPAGVWSDRFNRKNLMILADSGRLILLLSIPLVHVLSGETPVLLYCVQGGISLFSAVFDSAYGSCLPNIVGRSQLQEANAALQTGFSMSRIGGPLIAGILVSLLGTADTLFADVASYAGSIITLMVFVFFRITENYSSRKQ